MKVKLVALDVDGTLLTDDFRLTRVTVDTVQAVFRKGAIIVLCSGRGPQSILPVLEELGLSGVAVAHNGAVVIDSGDQNVLEHESFAPDKIEPYVRYARDHHLHMDACSFFKLYIESLTPELAAMYAKFHIEPIAVERIEKIEEPLVKMTMTGTEEELDQAEKELPTPPSDIRWIRSGERYIDVMRRNVSKGQALRKLASRWEIAPSQILAIGNYFNDLEMIQLAGIGIAMGNSPDVKRASDYVTESNNEDGAAKALSRYLLKE